MSVDTTRALAAGTVRNGALWSAVNTVFVKLATIAITAMVLRLVAPWEFGVFAVAATIYAIVSSFSDFGVGACLLRRDLDPRRAGPTVVALAIGTTCGLGAAMVAGSGWLAALMGAPSAASAIRVLSLSIILNGIFTAPTAMAAREFRQGLVFAASVVAFVPANASLVLLAVHGDGTMAFAWSRVIGQVCSGAFLAWRMRTGIRPRIDRTQVRQLLRFGLPLAGANIVNFTFLNMDYIFVSRRMGPVVLGIYMLAFNVASWATSVLSATVNTVAMPAFSHVHRDEVALRSALASAARSVSVIAFPISALTIALATPLVETIYGHKWSTAAPVLEILGAYGALFVMSLLFSNLLVGTGRTGVVMGIQVLWLVVLLPAMWVGATAAGLRGVAAAHIVVIAVVILPLYMFVIRKIARGSSLVIIRSTIRPLISAAAAGAAAMLGAMCVQQPTIALIVGGLAGVLCYATLSFRMLAELLPPSVAERLAGRRPRATS